jgi:hypothetical protein
MVVIIALVNTHMSAASATEGFDCASETALLNTPLDTGVYITRVKNAFVSSKTTIAYTNEDIKNVIAALTKIYRTIQKSESSYNPFYGKDVVNPPKSCGCYHTIAQNFDAYYLTPKNYDSRDQKVYLSALRYFFDIEDSKNHVIYTGLGNYAGSYMQDYYHLFLRGGSYTAPSEIIGETVYLANPKFKYYLNYFSKYLLLNSQTVNNSDILGMIVLAANQLLTQYTGSIYDKNLNPFPGKQLRANQLPYIVMKARSKTFADSTDGELCSGSKLNANSQKILNAIPDKKYFVAYLKGVIQAIQRYASGATTNSDWDPNGLIIKDAYDPDVMLLSDTYLFSNGPDNVYNLMEQFGHFEPLTNVYTLNTTGNLVVGQMSVDVKRCVVDYLEKMCVLAFAPIQYGGEVNYDRWGFF